MILASQATSGDVVCGMMSVEISRMEGGNMFITREDAGEQLTT
jgi:hypothetical protein